MATNGATDIELPEFASVDAQVIPDFSESFAASNPRLFSLDALRGFAMFWLIGGREFALAIVACLHPPLVDAVETQLTHPKWEGFVGWDLVMPLFLFVVGTSMPFALAKRIERGGASAYWRITRRVAVLWAFGAITQVIKPENDGMEVYSNALQAIAVGYLVTSLALLHLRVRGQIGLLILLMLGYCILLTCVPFAGHPAGTLERTANLPRYFDELVLGDYRRDHSFTWTITSLGFAATVLLGAQAGHVLRAKRSNGRRLCLLTAIGTACMAGGWFWGYWLPLNRHLWTSSMILWAGGCSFLLLALFYAVLDVAKFNRWSFPLIVIGANALLAYVLDPVVDQMSGHVVATLIPYGPAAGLDLLGAVLEIGSLWLLLWYLYRKQIFLRA